MTTPKRRGNVPLTKSEREKFIVGLIGLGKTNKEIADLLQVTRGRIDTIVRTRHLRERGEQP